MILSTVIYGLEDFIECGIRSAECGMQPKKLERVGGIEPPSPAWKAGTLPLSYTRAIPQFANQCIGDLR